MSDPGLCFAKTEIPQIEPWSLVVASLPIVAVLVVLVCWSLDVVRTLIACIRMVLQLLLVGFVLVGAFRTNHWWIVLGMLALMLGAAAVIALRPLARRTRGLYGRALLAIGVGGAATLAFVTQAVIGAHPWFQPSIVLPLGGMVFANAMNAVSLAAERYESERTKGEPHATARRTSLRAALIPLTNSFVAAGLVSLPGMMTGQILAGVDPLVAVRYQIVVMSMVFGSAGLSAACYLALVPEEPREGEARHLEHVEGEPGD